MESVTVHIARFDPETQESGWDEYEVALHEKTTILDCLDHIQKSEDPSLGFRYACRVGMCGSCAMVVNDKERWTCRTLVRDLDTGEITIEPLRNMPVIRDLAVDFNPLWKKYRQIEPAFEPGDNGQLLRAEARRRHERIEANLQCISCGICYSSCGYVASDRLYLGPHALNRAFTAVEDPRDGAGERRLRIVDNEHGCWKCHVQRNCAELCPMELSPSAGIQQLKRAILRKRILNPSRRAIAYAALGTAIAAVVGYVVYEPKRWQAIGRLDSFPMNAMSELDHGRQRLFIRRTDGQVEVISQTCPHQGCRVMWKPEVHEFQCPCHRGIFDREGVPIEGPPIRPLERYEFRVEDGMLQVFMS
jgi:succinate dehydrogenase/fumarate reductase iron-sulfur protein